MLYGDGNRVEMSITERRFTVRAIGISILVLCTLYFSIRHGGIWCAIIRSEGIISGQLEINNMNAEIFDYKREIIGNSLKQVGIQAFQGHFIPYGLNWNPL